MPLLLHLWADAVTESPVCLNDGLTFFVCLPEKLLKHASNTAYS